MNKSIQYTGLAVLTMSLVACSDSDDNDDVIVQDRFVIDTVAEEIVITDSETNLQWVNGLSPDSSKPETGCNPMPPGIAVDDALNQANDFCEILEFGGHDDWRLPTANQIQTYMIELDKVNIIPFYQSPACPRVIGTNAEGTLSTVNTHNTAPLGEMNTWGAMNAGVRCVRG